VRDREKVLEVAIGREVRAFRRQQEMTAADLAQAAGLSTGMLSKIENGNISPSLTTLATLAHALGVPLTAFFRRYEGVDVERAGTRAGQNYTLLGHLGAHAGGVTVEPYLITLEAETDLFPVFQHEGVETIYMLEGEVGYRHGERLFALRPGDTLFFEADAPHGPEELRRLPIRYLSIIAYPQSG
jgi:transcriptional regulator with XRE-family HTH domain